MLAEVNDDTILVNEDVEWNSSTGMENRIEAQSLFISEMVGFDVGGERIAVHKPDLADIKLKKFRPRESEAGIILHLSYRIGILLLLPEVRHFLESLALCLRNKLPYEESCKDTDHTVETICKRVTEVLAH